MISDGLPKARQQRQVAAIDWANTRLPPRPACPHQKAGQRLQHGDGE